MKRRLLVTPLGLLCVACTSPTASNPTTVTETVTHIATATLPSFAPPDLREQAEKAYALTSVAEMRSYMTPSCYQYLLGLGATESSKATVVDVQQSGTVGVVTTVDPEGSRATNQWRLVDNVWKWACDQQSMTN